MMLTVVGQAALSRGQCDLGAARMAESLTLAMSTGTHLLLVWTVQGIARVAAARDELERAARLYGASDALARVTEFGLPPLDRAGYEQTMEMVRGRLGDNAFEAMRATGQAMTLDEVIALALEVATVG
jgi:hypothetical protein